MKNWQDTLLHWHKKVFGADSYMDTRERALRLYEEATEVAQVVGVPLNDLQRQLEDTYARPVGKIHQELGGVFVTFLLMCINQGENALQCLQDEHARINLPEMIEKIQRSQAEKKAKGF
jgi:hypothetical protein